MWDVLCLVDDINVAMLLLHQWLTQPGQFRDILISLHVLLCEDHTRQYLAVL
jgi:hypothetical protein